MNAYWQQWDREDLDSWQGKEITSVQDDKDDIEVQHILKSKVLRRPDLMDEYGLSEWMFR